MIPFSRNHVLQLTLIAFAAVWIAAAWHPVYPADWVLENVLTVLAVAALVLTYRWFAFSELSYVIIAVFMSLHAVGSHYTYSEVPLGDWAKAAMGWQRNHFDRLVHFSFGLLWAYPFRELARRRYGAPPAFATLCALTFVLACGAAYEIIEWAVAAIVDPAAGQAYLGTQGDEFDGQKDMALAGLGAILTLAVTWLLGQRPRHG